MNDIPRQKLQYSITQHGRVICDNHKKCQALLRDLCPKYKREINILIGALKEKVATDLMDISTTTPKEILLARLTQRLYDNLGMAEEFASWAVESWALALGVISNTMPKMRLEQKFTTPKPNSIVVPKAEAVPSPIKKILSADRKWWKQLDEIWKNIFSKAIGINHQPNDYELVKIIKLPALNCRGKQITSLEPLSMLTNLQILACQENQITSLEPLRDLTNLRQLYCSHNQIVSLVPLQLLTKLQNLSCWKNKITSLIAIKNLKNLQELDCSYNKITSLEPICNLKKLRELFCYYNPIHSLDSISKLSELQRLDCYNTKINSLAELKSLKKLQRLNCVNTQLISLEGLQPLTNLQYLNCYNNNISSLEQLRQLTNLQQLYCKRTQIKSLKPLHNLKNLRALDCEETHVTENEVRKFQKAVPHCRIYAKPKLSFWNRVFS